MLVQRDWAAPRGEQTPVTDPEATLLNWATWVLPPNERVIRMVDA
jgi:hypothetical protein